MSTYYIADSIDKFTKAFKEVISEKNKIEKNKLAFEKEKFEFEKKFEKEKFEFEKKKEERKHKEKCEHEWKMTGSTITSQDVVHHYTCSKCGDKCGEKKSLSLGI